MEAGSKVLELFGVSHGKSSESTIRHSAVWVNKAQNIWIASFQGHLCIPFEGLSYQLSLIFPGNYHCTIDDTSAESLQQLAQTYCNDQHVTVGDFCKRCFEYAELTPHTKIYCLQNYQHFSFRLSSEIHPNTLLNTLNTSFVFCLLAVCPQSVRQNKTTDADLP